MTIQRYLNWGCDLIIAAVISVISIAGTFVWIALHPSHGPTAWLTVGLAGKSWTDINTELNHRLETRFPVGSSEDKLIAELRSEGFQKIDWRAVVDSEHEARRAENNVVCNIGAYVYWRADASGVLIAIRGAYREEGCL